MNSMFKTIVALSAALVLVLAALWLREQKVSGLLTHQLRESRETMVSLEAERNGLRQANEALHKQVSELRSAPPLFTALSQQSAVAALPPAAIVEEIPLVMETRDAGRSENREQRPEEVLTPEQQAEREQRMQEWAQRREEFRQRMVNDVQDRRAFFAQVSTEGLAPEYKASHERLLQAMGEVEASMTALSNPDLTREERRDIMRSMGEMSGEIRELMGKQREILLNDYAQQGLGLTPESTKQFMDYMQTVNQMTTPASMGGFMGRGGPPRAAGEAGDRR